MDDGHLLVNVSQKALILVDDKLLLNLEDDGWELPGGRVNQGEENLQDALKRELKEELSVEIEPGDLYSASLYTNHLGKRILVLVYECKLASSLDTIKVLEGEIKDWKLFSRNELVDLQIYENSLPALKKFLATT